jgi:hypothetical protein
LSELHAIESQARGNGVTDLEWLDRPRPSGAPTDVGCGFLPPH